MACLRFDPSPGLLCSGRRAIQLSTLTRTNSHQVHARLAFLIVKERNHSVQPCPRPKSPSLLAWPRLNAVLAIDSADTGGAGRDRTDGLLLAKQALSQLSYSPVFLALPPRLLRMGPCRRRLHRGGSGWIRTIDPRLIKTVL